MTPSTSNLINKLKTQKKVLLERPTAYRRNNVSKLENVVLENWEISSFELPRTSQLTQYQKNFQALELSQQSKLQS